MATLAVWALCGDGSWINAGVLICDRERNAHSRTHRSSYYAMHIAQAVEVFKLRVRDGVSALKNSPSQKRSKSAVLSTF